MKPIRIKDVVYRFVPGRKSFGDTVLERLYLRGDWERVYFDTLAFEVAHLYNNEDALYPRGQGGEFLKNFIVASKTDTQKAVRDYLDRYR